MNKVNVNGTFPFNIDISNDTITVDSNTISLDILNIDGRTKHILYENRSYYVALVALDREQKLVKIKVNGEVYQVAVTTQLDLLLKKLGMENSTASKVLQLKAPMPGLVLTILVKEGQEVKKGDSLLVLEAMKMENIIKSPTDGTINKIEVAHGDKIEKNTVLIKFS